jgi:methylated-DNA-[protein]-cysteine S-methyltransferase
MPTELNKTAHLFFTSVSTAFGPFAIVWWDSPSGTKIRQVFLCGKRQPEKVAHSAFPGVQPRTHSVVGELGRRIQAFLNGEEVIFDLESAALEVCGEFQRRVLMAEYRIPRGRVSTYGRIAKHIDAPRAGRAVGRALATNPFPILIPCHRAVQADGAVGGYQGGAKMKRALLEMEGVIFTDKGGVLLKNVHY